jgi:hypothetical protein
MYGGGGPLVFVLAAPRGKGRPKTILNPMGVGVELGPKESQGQGPRAPDLY